MSEVNPIEAARVMPTLFRVTRLGLYLWIGTRGIIVKPPWSPALFSERHRRNTQTLASAFGWRVLLKRRNMEQGQ